MHAKIMGKFILWVMSIYWYNHFGGTVISFEGIFGSYEDLVGPLIGNS